MHRVQKHQTMLGRLFVSKQNPNDALLITRRGLDLHRRYRRLAKNLLVSEQGPVLFDSDFVTHFLAKGRHGRVFTILAHKLSMFEKVTGYWFGVRNPKTMILKAFDPHSSPRVDGLSQVVTELAMFNFLKNRRNRFFVPRSPQYYFASKNALVRKFEFCPRASDLLFFFERIQPFLATNPGLARALRSGSTDYSQNALSNTQMQSFVLKNKISKREVEEMVSEVKRALLVDFARQSVIGANSLLQGFPLVVPDLESHDKNILVFGRDKKTGKLQVIVYDQPVSSIPNVVDLLINSPPNPRIRKRK